jgi:predicted permease
MSSLEIFLLLLTDVFLWMFVGCILANLPNWKEQWTHWILKRVGIGVLLPIVMAGKVLTHLGSEHIQKASWMVLGAVFMLTISWALTKGWVTLFFPHSNIKRALIFTNSFHNYGFMAYPIVYALWGEEALALIFFYACTCDALIWSIGILLIREKRKGLPWKKLLTPPFVALLIATPIALLWGPFNPSSWVEQSLHYGREVTFPLLLICTGYFLYRALKGIRLHHVWNRELFVSLTFRHLVAPFFWIGFVYLIVEDVLSSKLLSIEAIMPASIGTIALVTLYGSSSNKEVECRFAGMYALLSNLLATITIPLFLILIHAILHPFQ